VALALLPGAVKMRVTRSPCCVSHSPGRPEQICDPGWDLG
jgi:hypothetical protein